HSKVIQYNKSSWTTQNSADNQEKQFIIDLLEALWYLDIHGYKKLEEQKTNHGNKVLVKDIEQATTIKIQKIKKYYKLKNVLKDLPFWKPFNIEEYLPLEP
ncbi:23912_t:CDS:2, partial [Gigaspora margarita]